MFLATIGFLVVVFCVMCLTGLALMFIFVVPQFSGESPKIYEIVLSVAVVGAAWWFVWWICPFSVTLS